MDQLPFIPGQLIRRSEIHDRYGGSRQSGISTPLRVPYLFIFSGASGKQHGYKDGWDGDKVFSYSGEGQSGDMRFTKGNLALRDHIRNGKRVFLFEYVQKAVVKFVSELVLFDNDYFPAFDSNKQLRQGIRFFFHRIGVTVRKAYESQFPVSIAADTDLLQDYLKPSITEREGLVTSRVGQGAYRKSIIYRWDEKCAVTGYDRPDILIASHILGWKDSNNDQRLDPHNGILLSPTYDALFDRHLISFENTGKIILSDNIEVDAYRKIGVSGKESITGFNTGNYMYLEKHRNKFNRPIS